MIATLSASMLCALCVILSAGCGKPGSGASSSGLVGGGGAASTASTVKAIQDKIAADPSLKGAKITVDTDNGTINLTGTVKSPDQKDKAEAIVDDVQKSMNQQTGVNDNLMVGDGGSGGGASGGGQ